MTLWIVLGCVGAYLYMAGHMWRVWTWVRSQDRRNSLGHNDDLFVAFFWAVVWPITMALRKLATAKGFAKPPRQERRAERDRRRDEREREMQARIDDLERQVGVQ